MKLKNAKEALELIINQYEEIKALNIKVNSKALKNEEAIGNPDRKDYPLLRGKEVLLQAEIDGYIGQAFTSDPIAYSGSVENIISLSLERQGNYALMVATLNALANKLGIANHTIHCIDNEPEDCAKKIAEEVFEKHGLCNIGIIGYQPAIIENCVMKFGPEKVRATDLNIDNVGQLRYGIKILDGMTDTKELVDFADVILATGSILANGTDISVLNEIGEKPFYLFGTTCAALANFNNFNRLCPLSK